MTDAILARRNFDADGEQQFALASGDWNPLHLDAAAARRTTFGAPIVHGMHFVLWALDTAGAGGAPLRALTRMSVRFAKPLHVGEAVAIHTVSRAGNRVRLAIEVENAVVATINLEYADDPAIVHDLPAAAAAVAAAPQVPAQPAFLDITGMAGELDFGDKIALVAQLFPRAAAWLGTGSVAALAALSRLVGMECPGLYSVFSGFAVQFDTVATGGRLVYRVVSSEADLRVVRMEVAGGGIAGTVEAFARHAPARQAASATIAQLVAADEFAGQSALIVGGSRGLGEATAKIVAAGGAHAVITYASGEDDAHRVAAEIGAAGGRCSVLRYDACKPAVPQLAQLSPFPDAVYYYATGPIFDRRLLPYDPIRFQRFCRFYVDGFADLCFALASRSDGKIAILYPSSVAVESRPRDLVEYAMAKAAGEILCAELSRAPSQFDITVHRLPRTRTDQTVTIRQIPDEDALTVLLPLVRAVQAGSATARK
jgi:NAD(P)-dependent dehydrogenase (short-subunit alcohol dehydrogenase family)/acyl dehydratase